jgi:hypothetical protein
LSILLEGKSIQQLEAGALESRKVGYLLPRATKVQLDDCFTLKSPAAPTKGLWELLNREGENTESFGIKDRDKICLNLALSLLHLSTREWSLPSWSPGRDNSEGIFFLRDPTTRKIVDKTHPYLSYRLQERPKSKDDDSTLCDPQLLDFAKLIMEIHLWKKKLPLSNTSGKLCKEQLRRDLLALAHNEEYFRLEQEIMFTKAVEACLDIAGKEAAQDETNKDRLHHYIFNKIVRRLDGYANFPTFTSSAVPDSLPDSRPDSLPRIRKEPPHSPFDWKKELCIAESRLFVP